MTEEQKKMRKKSAESGNIKWIKDHCLRTMDGDDDYVFISYKSDDYEKVLDDIVFRTCQKYGLRVYFDTAFDDNSDSWIKQFYKNMCSKKCKAMIAFIDDAYYSSYATLLEMMARKTLKAGGDMKFDTLFFIPINIGKVTDIQDDANTGLGTERFSNKEMNFQAGEELKLFNKLFKQISRNDPELEDIYDRVNDTQLYGEKTEDSNAYGEMYLNITACRAIMKRVCPTDNNNDGTNKDFVEVIHDKLVNSGRKSVFGKVFSKPIKDTVQSNLRFTVSSEQPLPDPAPMPLKEEHQAPKQSPAPAVPANAKKEEKAPDTVQSNPTFTAPSPKPAPSSGPISLNEQITLKQFAEYCEYPDFCIALREKRESTKKQFFDYFMAAMLRGCDAPAFKTKKGEEEVQNKARYNYCTYAVSRTLVKDNPVCGASQFTWTSNARKAVDIPRAGKLGENSAIFETLDPQATIGSVLEKFKNEEPAFNTKNNAEIFAVWETIRQIDVKKILSDLGVC